MMVSGSHMFLRARGAAGGQSGRSGAAAAGEVWSNGVVLCVTLIHLCVGMSGVQQEVQVALVGLQLQVSMNDSMHAACGCA
jgi:hypothetical protein